MNTTTPLVSVCIPAFRAGRFIQETLESVGAQSYSSWEIIVTEDGSSDETEQIVRNFAGKVSQRVTFSHRDINKGQPTTRNDCINQAAGEWVALLDADDLWMPSHLEDLVSMMAEPGLSVVCSAATVFESETRRYLREKPQTAAFIAAFPVSLYRGEFGILPSSAIVRRDALIRSGMISLRYPICNDTELWFRLAATGHKFGFTRKSTCLYRKHRDSLSHQHVASLVELGRLYDEYASWSAIPQRIRRGKAASLYRYAGRILTKQSPREARAMFYQALKRDWRSGSTWYYYVRSFRYWGPSLKRD